jgi:DNA-binding HxlR family transcriptional regulator
LQEAKTNQFTALNVRKAKRIHPRTLNRYLQELCLFQYIQVAGGNKYREGYQYKITNLNEDNGLNIGIENVLKTTLENIRAEHSKTAGQNPFTNSQDTVNKGKTRKTTAK